MKYKEVFLFQPVYEDIWFRVDGSHDLEVIGKTAEYTWNLMTKMLNFQIKC